MRSLKLALATLLAMAPSFAQSKLEDREAIEKLLFDQQQAWNRGDLEGFMAGYWKSPELAFRSGGTVTRGWQETLDRYRRAYQAEGRSMGRLSFTDVEPDLLGPDRAMVTGRWELSQLPAGATPHGLFTLILARFPEGWRIVRDHTSSAETVRSSAADAAIEKELNADADALQSAVDARDAEAFLSHFAKEPELRIFRDGGAYDRDFGEFVRLELARRQEMRCEWSERRVGVLDESAATLALIYRCRGPRKDGTRADDNGAWTFVLRRRDDRWLIVQAHESHDRRSP